MIEKYVLKYWGLREPCSAEFSSLDLALDYCNKNKLLQDHTLNISIIKKTEEIVFKKLGIW